MKKIIFMTFMMVFLISLASGEVQTLGVYKPQEDINLLQLGAGFTVCNITTVVLPNSSLAIKSEVTMTKDGNQYNYTLKGENTTLMGQYIVNGYCTDGSNETVWAYDFEVSSSGRTGISNIALIIILIVMIYTITFISFFGKNIPLSIISGMVMLVFGIWIVRNGIVVYRDYLTNYFGYVTIGIGAIISLWASMELIENTP